ncbi:hypothetical protein GOODEAATRI_021878, partial [Goodea atripinnis]
PYIRCCFQLGWRSSEESQLRSSCSRRCFVPLPPALVSNVTATMTGIAAVSFFSNACRFAGCGLHFDSLSELIVHIEDNHIGKSQTAPSAPPRPKLADVATRGYS